MYPNVSSLKKKYMHVSSFSSLNTDVYVPFYVE